MIYEFHLSFMNLSFSLPSTPALSTILPLPSRLGLSCYLFVAESASQPKGRAISTTGIEIAGKMFLLLN